jgi:Saxitoxin biosynthesis operon protein SxtJ
MQQVKTLTSNRNFGFLLAFIFALSGAYYAVHDNEPFKAYGWLISSVVTGSIALSVPQLLTPFNRAWIKFGDLIGKVVSPMVLAIFFFIIITPVAIISRWLGRDELRLKKANVSSYWIAHTAQSKVSNSFKNEF